MSRSHSRATARLQEATDSDPKSLQATCNRRKRPRRSRKRQGATCQSSFQHRHGDRVLKGDTDCDVPSAQRGKLEFRDPVHGVFVDDALDDYPLVFAADVAEAFLSESPAEGEDAEHIRRCAMLIGEHVADRGYVGDWSSVDAKEFFGQLTFMTKGELVDTALTAVCLIGWLGGMGLMPPGPCIQILRGLAEHGPQQPLVAELAVRGQELVHNMALSTVETRDYTN